MPCTELFDAQSIDYQKSIFIPGTPVMSVEAAGIQGWHKYAHASVGIPDCFGQSAPAEHIYQHFGLTVPNLVERALQVISFYSAADGKTGVTAAPSLLDFPRFPLPVSLHPVH
jgi:transketolase